MVAPTSRDKSGRFIKGHKLKPGFGLGSKHTAEAKQKIAEAGMGRIKSQESIDKTVATTRARGNYFVSDEMKKHLSDVQKGMHHSPSTEFKKGQTSPRKGKGKSSVSYQGYALNKYGQLSHQVVWCLTNHIHRVPSGCVIHHMDGNKLNNNPDNLSLLTRADHMDLHRALNGGEL